jgi:alkanesulfonate monooxygenase SsuD/methylene tetrahydromethanopterin reductase-like flavin-dependent oxidoreductase (luciferase family)
VRDYTPYPRPATPEGPPLVLGGGGPRLLSLAGTHADIVSLVPAAATEGGLRATHLSLDSLKQKSALVRAAAGTRSRDPEMNILIFDVVISGDRRAAATSYLHDIEARLDGFVVDGELTVDQLLGSPHVLFGTHEQITEHVIGVREQTGASYISVFPHCMDDFAPVLTRLREL